MNFPMMYGFLFPFLAYGIYKMINNEIDRRKIFKRGFDIGVMYTKQAVKQFEIEYETFLQYDGDIYGHYFVNFNLAKEKYEKGTNEKI